MRRVNIISLISLRWLIRERTGNRRSGSHQPETDGVNNRLQLSRLERVLPGRTGGENCCYQALCCAIRHVLICGTFDMEWMWKLTLTFIIEGYVTLGHRVRKIGAGCVLKTALLAMTAKLAHTAWWKMRIWKRPAPSGRLLAPASRRGLLAGAHVVISFEMKKRASG